MRDLVVLFLHSLATVARLAGPGGARSVVAESVLVKQQLPTLSVSNSLSGGDGELDEIPAMGHPAHMIQVGGARHVSTRGGQRRLALQ